MNEVELIEEAMAAFYRSTGLPLSLVATEWRSISGVSPLSSLEKNSAYRADAFLELNQADHRWKFAAECKRKIDRATLLFKVKSQLDTYESIGLPLLITSYISAAMAEQCKQLDLNFIDTAGNGYLKAENLFVLVKGNKSKSAIHNESLEGRGGTSSGALRMIFSLICMPELLSAPYREIVDAAGIALGSVGWIFHDLETRGLISPRDKRKQRHFLDLPRLREEWAINYPHRLRPRLKTRRFSAANPNWWQGDLGKRDDFLWGGEVAAYMLDGYLKPATQTLYLKRGSERSAVNSLAGQYRWRADPEGQIEVLESFWNFEDFNSQQGIVPPLLIYSDLLATLDSRAMEAAVLLKRNHIDGTTSSR